MHPLTRLLRPVIKYVEAEADRVALVAREGESHVLLRFDLRWRGHEHDLALISDLDAALGDSGRCVKVGRDGGDAVECHLLGAEAQQLIDRAAPVLAAANAHNVQARIL